MRSNPSFRVVLHETIAYEIYVSARDEEAASDAAFDLYDRHGPAPRFGFETVSKNATVHAVQEQRPHPRNESSSDA
jgi:hypothetical protein